MGIRKNNVSIIVFLKYPRLGKVKTRLAIELGDKEALRIYRLLLNHTIKTLDSLESADVKLYINETPPENLFLGKDRSTFLLQKEGDLGQKMKSAFNAELKTYNKAIIIGSDCPEISANYLQLAESKLDEYDVVMGPAEDGGYYLLGLKGMHEDVFSELEWSSESVASSTIKRLVSSGESMFLLPSLDDVDYADDWKKYEDILTN